MWGTEYNWIKAANHFLPQDYDVKDVKFLLSDRFGNCKDAADARYMRRIMAENGILEQVIQVCKENDINIPNE